MNDDVTMTPDRGSHTQPCEKILGDDGGCTNAVKLLAAINMMYQSWRWSRTARRCLRDYDRTGAQYAAEQASALNEKLLEVKHSVCVWGDD